MNNSIKTFTDLNAWKESHQLVLMVYKLIKEFPKEKIQFYYQAQGSLTEIKNQLLTAKDLGYLKSDKFDQTATQANIAHQLLQGLITKSKTFLHKS